MAYTPPQYTPPSSDFNLEELLHKTILAPMDATLAFVDQLYQDRPNTNPFKESWKVLTGDKPRVTGEQLATTMGLPNPKLSGLGLSVALDPTMYLPVGKVAEGLIAGVGKGSSALLKAIGESGDLGSKVADTVKGIGEGFENTFKAEGHIPTNESLGLPTKADWHSATDAVTNGTADTFESQLASRDIPLELHSLLKNKDFLQYNIDERTLDKMSELAKEFKGMAPEDLEMVNPVREAKFNLDQVYKITGQMPSVDTVNLANKLDAFEKRFTNIEVPMGIRSADLGANSHTGYVYHMLTPEAKQIVNRLLPSEARVGKGSYSIKQLSPKIPSMINRMTGYLDVPEDALGAIGKSVESVRKYWNTDYNVFRIPGSNEELTNSIADQLTKMGKKPDWGFWTGHEINTMARAGELPALRGIKVDKFVETNPYITSTYRLMNTAKSVSSRGFINKVSRLEEEGGFARQIPDGMKLPPEGWNRSPLVSQWLPDGDRLMFPNEVLKVIDRVGNQYKFPEEVNGFLKTYDKVQGFWKRWTLQPIPAYHARNMIGNMFNAYLAGLTNPTRYLDAMRIVEGSDGKIGKYTFDEVRSMIQRYGIRGRGFFGKEAVQEDFMRNLMEHKEGVIATLNPVKLGRSFGTTTEDNARIGLFIDRLAKGDTPMQAEQTVKKFLFNYDELSTTERKMFRRIMPFYSWTRFNIPMQLEQAIKQPAKWSMWYKGAKAVGGDESEAPDDKYMPDWMKQGMPIYWKRNSQNGDYQYLLLHNWIPAVDLQDLIRPGKTLESILSPLIKTPIEWFGNYSLQAEKSLERYPGDSKNYLGMQLPNKVVNLLKNVRILNELDKMNPALIFGTKDTPGMFGYTRSQEIPMPQAVRFLNILSGFPLQQFNLDSAKKNWDNVQAQNVLALMHQYKFANKSNPKQASKLLDLIEQERNR